MTTTLLQLAPLPEPGLFGRLVDGQPWLISAVLAVAGAALYITLRNQNRQRLGALSAAILILAAGGLQLAAYLITTERERMTEATMELVRATAAGDAGRVDTMVTPDVRAMSEADLRWGPFNVPRAGIERERLLASVDMLGRVYRIHEYAVLEVQAQQRGPTAGRTQVRVRVTPEQHRAPFLSWWRIDWRKDAQGEWKASIIEAMEIDSPFSQR